MPHDRTPHVCGRMRVMLSLYFWVFGYMREFARGARPVLLGFGVSLAATACHQATHWRGLCALVTLHPGAHKHASSAHHTRENSCECTRHSLCSRTNSALGPRGTLQGNPVGRSPPQPGLVCADRPPNGPSPLPDTMLNHMHLRHRRSMRHAHLPDPMLPHRVSKCGPGLQARSTAASPGVLGGD